jgi:hypothetical protein
VVGWCGSVCRPLNMAASMESGSRCVSVSTVVAYFLPPASGRQTNKTAIHPRTAREAMGQGRGKGQTYVEENRGGEGGGLRRLHLRGRRIRHRLRGRGKASDCGGGIGDSGWGVPSSIWYLPLRSATAGLGFTFSFIRFFFSFFKYKLYYISI